jgi:hypothetical protein
VPLGAGRMETAPGSAGGRFTRRCRRLLPVRCLALWRARSGNSPQIGSQQSVRTSWSSGELGSDLVLRSLGSYLDLARLGLRGDRDPQSKDTAVVGCLYILGVEVVP